MSLPEKWSRGPRPDPQVLALIDELREAAARGHVRALAIITINPLLEVEGETAGELDSVRRHLLLGGLEVLKVKIQKLG